MKTHQTNPVGLHVATRCDLPVHTDIERDALRHASLVVRKLMSPNDSFPTADELERAWDAIQRLERYPRGRRLLAA
ncbi:hypothetical protein [Phenylobacterium immobile]|uniref:hypothetical protein n=1 Tax=Phenylobacterium immobile TaxID=21 RepID=UPI000ABD7554|nr:hypothetical protein [Phenylobacterium immobile]